MFLDYISSSIFKLFIIFSYFFLEDSNNTSETTLSCTLVAIFFQQLTLRKQLRRCMNHCIKSVRIRSYSGPHFPAFGLNTKRYSVSLCIQSECGKMRTRKTPNMDTFHALNVFCFFKKNNNKRLKRFNGNIWSELEMQGKVIQDRSGLVNIKDIDEQEKGKASYCKFTGSW